MANVLENVKLVDLALLSGKYTTDLKAWVEAKIGAEGLRTVAVDETNNKLKFYVEAADDVTAETSPAFSIDFAKVARTGKAEDVTVDAVEGLEATDVQSAIEELLATIGTDTLTTTAQTVIGGVNELDAEIGDMSTITVETAEGVKATTVVAAANQLQTEINTINTTIGEAPDTEAGKAGSGMKKDIADLQEAIEDAEAAGKVTMEETSTGLPDDVLKKYDFYQGVLADDTAEQKAAKKIGTINLAKDLVVTSGEVVVLKDGDVEGLSAGTYLKLTIANQTAPVYINVADLAHDYTVEEDATQVQMVISDEREISATIVEKSITVTELADEAVETAKIKDAQVTAAKLAENAIVATVTEGTVASTTMDDVTVGLLQKAEDAVPYADIVLATEDDIKDLFKVD